MEREIDFSADLWFLFHFLILDTFTEGSENLLASLNCDISVSLLGPNDHCLIVVERYFYVNETHNLHPLPRGLEWAAHHVKLTFRVPQKHRRIAER